MANYRDIKGFQIANKDSDPITAGGSWSSAAPINTARFQTASAGATQHASFLIGGAIPPVSPNISGLHEQYNGTAWTEAGDLGQAKYALATLGTTTSALTAGGYNGLPPNSGYTTQSESWNGSSWTEVSDLNTGRTQGSGTGSSTSALAFAGYVPPNFTFTAKNESWNGSSWTEAGDLNQARSEDAGGSGNSNTTGLCFGGFKPPGSTPNLVTANTEFFDGSSWTEVNDLSTARQALGKSRSGSSKSGLAVGGYNGTATTGITEEWAVNNTVLTITTS